jgi:hypothetical protein
VENKLQGGNTITASLPQRHRESRIDRIAFGGRIGRAILSILFLSAIPGKKYSQENLSF